MTCATYLKTFAQLRGQMHQASLFIDSSSITFKWHRVEDYFRIILLN